MRAFLILFSMLNAGLCGEPCVVVVDSIEVNEIISHDGSVVFRQVWYLEWDTQREGGEVREIPVSRGWRRLVDGGPVVVEGIGAIDEFEEGDRRYQVIAPVIAYTVTNIDPETRCREAGAYRPICP